MNAPVTIAVDVMSGDVGPAVTVAGALSALKTSSHARFVLVGQGAVIHPLLATLDPQVRDRLQILEAAEVVGMDESPRDAIRRKKDSSLRRALDCVADGKAQACISAGNTGALMACAHFVLGTVPGVERAAIVSGVPTLSGRTVMLDLGANALASATQLLQFAVMGAVIAGADTQGAPPRVGLLNIGHEEIKGTAVVKAAHQLLKASGLRYVGYVEADEIFSGTVDVVVTDGFSGNVALKSMEGLARMIGQGIREEFSLSLTRKLSAWFARPALIGLKDRWDPRRYNGASMVGLAGVVIKSHGGADSLAFGYAVSRAIIEAQSDVPTQIAKALQSQAS